MTLAQILSIKSSMAAFLVLGRKEDVPPASMEKP